MNSNTFKQILFTLLVFTTIKAYPNAAQPGIFNAGGDSGFRPLFEEDSLFVQQIQMQSEDITIDLYPGYAVVYGQYEMFNHSDSTLKFKVGYPVNPIFGIESNDYRDAHVILVDSLYSFQSMDKNIKTVSDENDGKWYYWEQSFAPLTTTHMEAKFIVNTNDGHVRKGYTKRHYNAFIYLLESAATWKGNIEDGNIKVFLNEGLSIKKIKGSQPSNLAYSKEHNALAYKFENKAPGPTDNLILTYGKRIDDFEFEEILENSENKMSAIQQKANDVVFNDLELVSFDDPFDTQKKKRIKTLPLLAILIGIWILVKLFRSRN